jgi:PAS domain S-box-containing protein
MADETFKDRLEKYFNTDVIGFIETDSDKLMWKVNQGICDTLGYTESEMIGRSWASFVHPSDLGIAQSYLDRLENNEIKSSQFELRAIMKSGESVPLLASVQAGGQTKDGKPNWYGVFLLSMADLSNTQKALADMIDKQEKVYSSTVQSLSHAIEARDPYTAGHQLHVAGIATQIGTKLGMEPNKIKGLYLAGVVHDIGKIGVPVEYLTKPTKLTDLEFAVIKNHPEIGFQVLKDIDMPWPIASITHQHHERLDGTGYPNGLCKDEILPEAKVLAVADTIDSMMEPRPYRSALGWEVTLNALRKDRGNKLDPNIVDASIEIFG